MVGCVEHFPMIPDSIDPIEKPDARDVDCFSGFDDVQSTLLVFRRHSIPIVIINHLREVLRLFSGCRNDERIR